MTMEEYQEISHARIRAKLGEAFLYAVDGLGVKGADFAAFFAASSLSKRIEFGDYAISKGKSGVEIALLVMEEIFGTDCPYKPYEFHERAKDYWIGSVVAAYQERSNRSFAEIFIALPYDELERVYETLHEADISLFFDLAEARMAKVFPETRLRRLRSAYGCSQAELSRLSGVSLRSIQMYEQRQKDIDKANAISLFRIARVLGCRIEDLLEKKEN